MLTPIKPCHYDIVTLLSSRHKREYDSKQRGAADVRTAFLGLYPFSKMTRLTCLLLIWTICEGVFANEEKQKGFVVEPLDFAPIFAGGFSSLASSPIAAAVLKADKSQYPLLFDTLVSSTIDNIRRRIAPKENVFSAERFGFNPIASQGWQPPAQAARLVAPPQQRYQQQYQQQQLEQPLTHLPIRQQLSAPLRYDIRQVHDADYRVYKPEENEQGEEILAALKQNPSVSSYFQPQATNLEVAHPIKYRKQELVEGPDSEQKYKPNAYISGAPRIRRYAHGRKSEKLREASDDDEEEDPYDYKAEYVSRPKEFDSSLYSSPYKQKKNNDKDDEYPYDSEYDYKAYERVKELSEKQAAEIRQNPGNCKAVQRDGMTCNVCKDPKTGGNYESCSYVQEPKNNKYAYSKENKFDSNDQPDEPEQSEEPKKSEKYQKSKEDSREYSAPPTPQRSNVGHKQDDDSDGKYKAYYVHSSKPKPSEALRAAESSSAAESESDEEGETDTLTKPYNYKQALPGFYSDNEPKKDVEHVLAEFKKKDRSSCKKVQKNGMTCFQCIDKTGLKNEECMFVSESAPKSSHLAYQEVKEFTSKPPPLDTGNVGAESQTITTNAPPAQRSAAYVVADPGYGKKLKHKKARITNPAIAATIPVAGIIPAAQQRLRQRIVKRSVESEADAEAQAAIVDETNIAPPEEFAGDNSKGAFWADTMPRYSAALGVTLPEFMLAPSEHEAAFDEVVAGA
ncbi:hypothetical protein O0L34_g7102 [Tuta absoluta]|nr:hypothetical protein O0L34_g7102 [Tuta absoluta]